MTGLKRRAVTSLISSYASQFGTTAADFLSKMLLARLILPDQWGIFAEAMMVVLIADVFTDLGLSQHMVREKHKPFGNVLIIRVGLSVAAIVIVEAFAGYLSFLTPDVVSPVRVLAPFILLKAIGHIPTVFVDRELVIHKSLAPQFVKLGLMAGISVWLALDGYGVWALVAGTLVSEAAYSALMWLSVRGHMQVQLTTEHTRSLISGSRYLFLIALISLPLQQGDIFVVGSLLDPGAVGLYAMALTLVTKVSKVVETSIYRVIYPVFCQVSDDRAKMGEIYKCMTLAIIAIEAPVYMFLMFHSKFFVGTLLGDKWMPMAVILQGLAMSGVSNPFGTFGMEVLRATKQDSVLLLSTIAVSITIPTAGFLLTRQYGVMGMVAANYLQVSLIFMVPALWRTIRPQFIDLARKLVFVYVFSFTVSGAAFLFTGDGLTRSFAGAGAVLLLWSVFLRMYGRSVGKETLRLL